jgi:hypothetical protein
VVRRVDDVEARVVEARDHPAHRGQRREGVAGPLQEQQRHLHVREVPRPRRARRARRVEGEADEDDPRDPERGGGFGPRGHASAHRLAAGEHGQAERSGRRDHGAHRRLEDGGGIGATSPRVGEGELVPQDRHAPRDERRGEGREERVLHARPRAVGEDEHRPGVRGPIEDRPDGAVAYRDAHRRRRTRAAASRTPQPAENGAAPNAQPPSPAPPSSDAQTLVVTSQTALGAQSAEDAHWVPHWPVGPQR